jgi:hypothetical protein
MITILVVTSLTFENSTAQNFTKITSGPLVSDVGGFLGTAWGDYDGDGYVDLFVANYQNPNMLFHNDGNGSFTKVTTGEIVTDQANSYSASWGDYDNDGDLDLFVANMGGGNFLYRNDGDSLTRIKQGIIATDGGLSYSGSWGDYDNDGDLDLFVANDGQKNFLYRNNGDGTFNKIVPLFGGGDIVNDVARSVVGLWGDYDNDGDLDLYVVNGAFSREKNSLYRNDLNGKFTKITSGRIINDIEGSTGGSWGDYDNDGYLDMYVCNSVGDAPNSLYHNNGDGTFTKITAGPMVTESGHSTGSSWVDYDNDGDLDLFVVNVLGQKNCLYQNKGDGTFTKITTGDIVNDTGWSYGCSWADYDNDGDQDVIVTNGGFYTTLKNFVYKNNGNQNKWITIQCQGTVTNTSAIGAMVRVKAKIAGKAVWQMQQILGQTGWFGQNSLDVEFGLGNASVIDSLVIEWTSGSVQVLTNVAVNQSTEIIEVVRYHDLQVEQAKDQTYSLPIFSNVFPRTVVSNSGINDEVNVEVTCEIDSAGTIVYSDTKLIDTLSVKRSAEVAFKKWVPLGANTYSLKYAAVLVEDAEPEDNSFTVVFEISNLLDDFESGLTKWQVSSGWGLQEALVHAGKFSLDNSPQGEYDNNVDNSAAYNISFDLSQAATAHLSCWTQFYIEQDRDFGYIEISSDSGKTWEKLGDAFTGIQASWALNQCSLAEYCGQGFNDVRLRFRFVSDSSNTFSGWLLDDIALYSTGIETKLDSDAKMLQPTQYILFDNYPNPFNPETAIEYELPQAGSVRLEIYNMLGQKAKTLIDQNQAAGIHRAIWDGKNDVGEAVTSGVYLYRLETANFKATKRMVLIR